MDPSGRNSRPEWSQRLPTDLGGHGAARLGPAQARLVSGVGRQHLAAMLVSALTSPGSAVSPQRSFTATQSLA